MDRTVAHLDIDNFFVAVERLRNARFRSIPLIIGGGTDRGTVAACSHEARTFGVRPSMPVSLALKLCPAARVVRGDLELYSAYSHTVTEIIGEAAPVMEKAGIDQFYLDLSGMDKFFGTLKWTTDLSTRIAEESGLDVSFGLSVNKTVSRIATGEGKPHGKLEVPKEMVRPFLNPLSIRKMPAVGDVTFQLLSRIGIRNIGTLAEVPVELLQELIGKPGIELSRRANGVDPTPVEPYSEAKSVSTEHTFPQDTIDIVKVKTHFTGMVEKLAYQLRQEGWLASVVTVKVRYNNADTHTKQRRIPYTSCDHMIIRTVMDLFDQLYERRMRLQLVGIRLGGLVRGSYQVNLFEDTTELISLYQAIDKMKKRFGFTAIQRCAALNLQR